MATVQVMNQAETMNTELWFTIAQLRLIRLIERLETKIRHVPEIDKPGFIDLQNKVVAELNSVEADERAHFMDGTLLLHPPTATVIEETKQRCEALGQVIDAANKAAAVVTLVNDVLRFVQGVRS